MKKNFKIFCVLLCVVTLVSCFSLLSHQKPVGNQNLNASFKMSKTLFLMKNGKATSSESLGDTPRNQMTYQKEIHGYPTTVTYRFRNIWLTHRLCYVGYTIDAKTPALAESLFNTLVEEYKTLYSGDPDFYLSLDDGDDGTRYAYIDIDDLPTGVYISIAHYPDSTVEVSIHDQLY